MTDLREYGLVPLAEMREELAHAAIGIPLHARDGTIRAFAMVDREDLEGLSVHNWHLTPWGYAVRWVGGRKNRRQVWMHREVLHLAHNDPRQCDHVNRSKLDNRRANLRIVADGENKQNVPSRRGSTSKFRGVHWRADRKKWVAMAGLKGKTYYLGSFDSEEKAADAAAAWRETHMPFTTE